MTADGQVPGFAGTWLVPLAEESLFALVALRVLRQSGKQDAMPQKGRMLSAPAVDNVFRQRGGSSVRKVPPVTVEILKFFCSKDTLIRNQIITSEFVLLYM
jgi:hypothetical protein